MPLLVTITRTGSQSWVDDTENTWVDDTENIWASGESLIRVSNENLPLEHYWDGHITSFDPISFQMSQLYGGYCKMSMGSVSLTNDVFDSAENWPPPKFFEIKVEYTATNEAAAETLFEGTAFRTGWNREELTYNLYGAPYLVDLLEEIADYNGDTVPIPRAFGDIQHRQPLRLPDVSGDPTYHNGYLSGTKGTDWHVYDDGVLIDSNVTDNGDDTFSLSVAPVGEVTISGTGTLESIDDIFTWACNTIRLNLTYTNTYVAAHDLACWISSQQTLISFLDKIAAFTLHLFYIAGTTLTIVDLDTDNGTGGLAEYNYFKSSGVDSTPVANITAEWTERNAVEETIGKYIKSTDKDLTVKSDYYYGSEETIQTYDELNRTAISSFLTNIISKMNADRARVTVPLLSGLPVPGKAMTFTDTTYKRDVSWSIRARDITYDFDSEEVTIEGEGTVS